MRGRRVSTQDARERGVSKSVLVRMRDDELIEGEVAALDLDRPDFELIPAGATNNTTVVVPFSSVHSILLERRKPDGDFFSGGHLFTHVQKAVVHFWDGEHLRGFVRRAPKRGQFGVEIELLNTRRETIEIHAVPHAAIKGVFFVKSWDSRPGEYERETGHWAPHHGEAPLVELLGEIRTLDHLRADGSLSDDEFARRRRFVLDRI